MSSLTDNEASSELYEELTQAEGAAEADDESEGEHEGDATWTPAVVDANATAEAGTAGIAARRLRN